MQTGFRRLYALIASTLLLFALAAIMRAQGASVTGVVQDSTGAVIAGASIEATGPDGRRYTTTTDSNGRFSLLVSTAGDYSVRATLAGFAPLQRSFSVAVGQSASLTLQFGATGQRAVPPPSPPPPPPPTAVPAPPAAGYGQPDRSPASTPPSESHANITVFFATDRAKGNTQPLPYTSIRQSDGTLHYGQVDVHIPRDHHVGVIERPNIWTFWREDPNKTFMITRFSEQATPAFFRDVRAVVGRSQAKQAFVFVHGFNVSFESAVYRTAQLAYDLSFDGAPILYSWPAKEGLASYPTDLNNSDWTVEHLRTFLEQVSAQSGAQTIHLIAHSMGNRALANALARLASNPVQNRPHFNQLVLTAPDVDASVFRGLAAQFQPLVSRATLYASSKDEALAASRALQGYQRAGDTDPTVVIVPGMDTIDVSNVDSNLIGHFYYGENRSVISDLRYVLEGLLPSARATLEPRSSSDGAYWRFKP